MSGIVTLSTLRSLVRTLSDFENSEFLPSDNVELDLYINGSMADLYDEMVNAYQDYFISSYIYQTNVVSNGQSMFELPLRFQKLQWLASDANTTKLKTLERISPMESNTFLYGNSNIPSTYILCAYVPAYRFMTTTAKTFTAADVLVSPSNIINVNDHDLVTGEKIYLSNTGGALPGGLFASTAYYVIVLDKDFFSLATNPHDAFFYKYIQDPTKRVTITPAGSGTNTIVNAYDRFDGINGYEMYAVWDAVAKVLHKAERDPQHAILERDKQMNRLKNSLISRDQGRSQKMWDVNMLRNDYTMARDSTNYMKYFEFGRNFVLVNGTNAGWP